MTEAEYNRLFAEARHTLGNLTVAEAKKLRSVYLTAAQEVGQRILDATNSGKSALTIETWRSVQDNLNEIAQDIGTAVDSAVKSTLAQGNTMLSDVSIQYIASAAAGTGIDMKSLVTFLDDSVSGTNTRLIAALTSKVYKSVDGTNYSYSDKIWSAAVGIVGDFNQRINDLVLAGLAQGRDPAQIAHDLEAYVKDGLPRVVGRWGQLVPGTRQYIRRLGKAGIDYRALRLLRSELYSGLQLSSVWQAQENPAFDQVFDWVLQAGREDWPCACPSLADDGPYELQDVPGYPHPNCACLVRPRLVPRAQFQQMLVDYVNGANTEGAAAILQWLNGG